MHPQEYKYEKAATGRFTHLCLKNSEIHMGINFDHHPAVQSIINDPRYAPRLLYPGRDAVDLSANGFPAGALGDRQLVVFLLDATWRNAKRMFNRSLTLQKLPRLMFVPLEQSRYLIKKQPHSWCLSTIEATHELMLALEKAGLDTYARPNQMLDLFDRMQRYQIDCMHDPTKPSFRHGVRRKIKRKITGTVISIKGGPYVPE
jgi:DTW domain-containing protein YfiP